MAYKVVVIEDEPQVAELLRMILRHDEIEVFVSFDGISGLETIRRVNPNLVILDIMMPNMNGWQVYDTIRSEEALCHIPVIIETVLPERPERKQTFAISDIDIYFTKPFDTTRLRREVGRMLGNEQLWPPPKPRTPRPLPDSASGDFVVAPDQDQAAPSLPVESPPVDLTAPASSPISPVSSSTAASQPAPAPVASPAPVESSPAVESQSAPDQITPSAPVEPPPELPPTEPVVPDSSPVSGAVASPPASEPAAPPPEEAAGHQTSTES